MSSSSSWAGKAMTGLDSIFLKAEIPERLMNISGIYLFGERMPMESVHEVFKRLVEKEPRFREGAVSRLGSFFWVPETGDFTQHITEITLSSEPGSTEEEAERNSELAFQTLVGELSSRPLASAEGSPIALWQSYLVQGLKIRNCSALTNKEHPVFVSALVTILHHAITDGQGAVRCLLSMSGTPDVGLANEKKTSESSSPTSASRSPLSIVTSLLPCRILSQLIRLAFFLLSIVQFLLTMLYLSVYRKKTFTAPTATANKAVAWSRPISLDEIKRVKNLLGCSVNDVIVGALSGALRLYLQDRGQLPGAEKDLIVGIPVSVRGSTDFSLGNKVSMVNLFLPVQVADPLECVATVQRRMNRLKKSAEVPVGALWFRIVGRLPSFFINKTFADYFMNKYHAILTNVPGPSNLLTFAGKTIGSYIPVIPTPGRGAFGLAILSYADQVIISGLGDNAEDCRAIVDKYFPMAVENIANAATRISKQ